MRRKNNSGRKTNYVMFDHNWEIKSSVSRQIYDGYEQKITSKYQIFKCKDCNMHALFDDATCRYFVLNDSWENSELTCSEFVTYDFLKKTL